MGFGIPALQFLQLAIPLFYFRSERSFLFFFLEMNCLRTLGFWDSLPRRNSKSGYSLDTTVLGTPTYYQVYKYETGNFLEKIHVYLIKMVIHSIFKVTAIASHTFFPSLWQFVYASPKKLFPF